MNKTTKMVIALMSAMPFTAMASQELRSDLPTSNLSSKVEEIREHLKNDVSGFQTLLGKVPESNVDANKEFSTWNDWNNWNNWSDFSNWNNWGQFTNY